MIRCYFARNCSIAEPAPAAPILAMSSSSCGVLPLTPIAPITLPSNSIGIPPCNGVAPGRPAQLHDHHEPDLQTPCLGGGKSRPSELCRSRPPHSRPVYRRAARATTDDRRRQRQQSPRWRRVFSLPLPLPLRSSFQLQVLELSSPAIALWLGSRESSVERAQEKRFVSFDR